MPCCGAPPPHPPPSVPSAPLLPSFKQRHFEPIYLPVLGHSTKAKPGDLLCANTPRFPNATQKAGAKMETGNQSDTHIFIPGCIAHEILHNVLCCTCAHTSPSSRSMHWQLRSAAFSWILSVFVPLSLVGKARCEFTIPRYPWNNDSGCSDRVRHVLNGWSLGRTFIEQQFGPIERCLWRIQYG